MKRLILVKPTKSIQLGHLYEHLFCMSMASFLQTQGLYPLVDYRLHAKTYHSGLIFVVAELRSVQAVQKTHELPYLHISLEQECISTAYTQLLAELEEPVENTGYDAMINSLRLLDGIEWLQLDEVEEFDGLKTRTTAKPVYVSDGGPLRAGKLSLRQSMNIDFIKQNRHLLPLFRNLAHLFAECAETLMADKHGYFSNGSQFKATRQKTYMETEFKVAHANEGNARQCHEGMLSLIQELYAKGVVTRYLAQLQDLSYYERAELAPNPEVLYEDTMVLIGSKGWKGLATMENCKLLLEHITVEVCHGKEAYQEKPSVNF